MPQPPEKGPTEPNRAFLAHLQQMFGYLHESQKKFYDTRELCGSWRDYEHLPINPSIQMDVDEFYNMLFEQLESAHDELEFGRAVGNFDRVIVNDDLETAFAELDAAALGWYPQLRAGARP